MTKRINIVGAMLLSLLILTSCSTGIESFDDFLYEEYAAPFEESENRIHVKDYNELRQAIRDKADGDVTILCEDGIYQWPDWAYFDIKGEHTTIRSLSGNREAVVFKGQGMDGNGNSVLHITADYVSIRDITICDAKNHGIQIHGESQYNADNVHISNVIFKDINEQMIKGSSDRAAGAHTDRGIIENCLFYYSAGIANQYYCGGIDIHDGTNWIVRNNTFKDIISPDSSLTEGAIHFWSESGDTLIEKNVIINCDRGIMLGFDNSPHYGGVVKNNFIHVVSDTGIYLCNTEDVKVYNNTVFVDSDYLHAIEYRFSPTTNLEIKNNLTNKLITSRNSATASVSSNIAIADSTWFADARGGDLHLSNAIDSVIDKGEALESVSEDIDGEDRTGPIDIGADEL